MCVCLYLHTYVCMHVHTYVRTCVCMCACVHTCVCVHVHVTLRSVLVTCMRPSLHANVWHKQPMHVHVSVSVTDGPHAVPSGNDLARALKWGSGYTGEKPVSILRGLENTDKVDFDRCVCMCACMRVFVCVCVCVHLSLLEESCRSFHCVRNILLILRMHICMYMNMYTSLLGKTRQLHGYHAYEASRAEMELRIRSFPV